MREKLKTLPETEYLQSCAAHYASRLEKAKSIGVTPDSEFYPAYLEVKFRAETLAECALYVHALPGVLATKEIVFDVTRYIISFFQRHPSPEETDADYSRALELVGDTSGEFRKFCACMDVFSNYAPENIEQEYIDLVRYITSGIQLWLAVRSNIVKGKAE